MSSTQSSSTNPRLDPLDDLNVARALEGRIYTYRDRLFMDRESKRKAQYYLERGARFVNADTTIQLALRQQAEKRRTASRILHGTHTSCMFDSTLR